MVMAADLYRYAEVKVSHGGKIQRSSQGGEPEYIGGETKLLKVPRSITLREFHDRLAAIAGCFKVAVRYVRPNDSLDALRDVVTGDDLQHLLDWVLLRDLQIHLKQQGANPVDVALVPVPRVWVLVVRVDVRPPLPESLFSSAPTTKTPVPPSCLNKRSASAPSRLTNSADDTSKPPSPSLIQRSTSASTLTTSITTTAAAGSTRATQGDIVHGAAPYPALHRGPVGPAPVFCVPVVPVIVYQTVIPVYQGFLVPAGLSQRGSPARRLK